MNNYIVNVCVDTKTTDIYDKVAVNKFPMIISCMDDDRLKDMLNDDDVKNYIKHIMSKRLYQNAQYYIVRIREGYLYDESDKFYWDLKQITNVEEYRET